MSYTFTHVKRYKRGAKWDNGDTRTCTRCRIERSRAKQAVVTALMKYAGSQYKVPVAYCEDHTPEDLA
jgi:hypothetical protein